MELRADAKPPGSVVGKHQIERALYEENKDVSAGRLKEENPLDTSAEFRIFCDACRRGDLRVCQEQISGGVNINARDTFDYTPLILASLCGHYEVVQMLLEQGALCERDTFQGERCLYNALNDRIRNLLLSYDYSKSTDPLQPLAAHITSLLTRDVPKTADITVETGETQLRLHKFLLSARSPYFAQKLATAPETTHWRTASSVPSQSFETCVRHLYLGDVGADLGDGEEEQTILTGIDKLSRQLEIPQLFENILSSGDRRLARQKRTEEIEKGRDQLALWFETNVLKHKVRVETDKVDGVKWDRDNGIFADVLLQADEDEEEEELDETPPPSRETNGIPIGNFQPSTPTPARQKPQRHSLLYPCHRAMLLRSELFATMFASPFREGQMTPHLQIIPVDCPPDVLEIILTYLYTERADFPLAIALDVLAAADMLFIEKLKQRAALLISTLGNGGGGVVDTAASTSHDDADQLDIYAVIRAGWDTRVHRLEEFGARYIAYRLERFVNEPEFAALVRESAARIMVRQETDTVELVDDVRWYLSERFRLRFEDAGLDEMMDEGAREEAGGEGEGDADADEVLGLEAQGVVRTLDGEIAGDEFAQDALNYRFCWGRLRG